MLCENIKKLRLKMGKAQNQVADELGIKRTTYSNYETGLREPNAETLVAISQYFGVTVDYLLDVLQDNSYTTDEMKYVRKCRSIDKNGINLIKSVIDNEYNRCRNKKELEETLINEYSKLPDNQKKAVLEFMRDTISKEEARKSELEQKNIKLVMKAARDGAPPGLVEVTDEEEEIINNLPDMDPDYFNTP